MVEKSSQDEPISLDHPLRLKLYLYARTKGEPIGIRDTQRTLNINSASTVKWHLDKLVETGHMKQHKDSRYSVVMEFVEGNGLTNKVQIPIEVTAMIFRDKLVSPLIFLVAFLTLMLGSTLFLWYVISNSPMSQNLRFAILGIQGAISILVTLLSAFYMYLKIQHHFRQYLNY